MMDRLPRGSLIEFKPERTHLQLFSAFLQDEISLLENQWTLTIGAKLQHNDYTGFEGQPSVRLLWKPDIRHSAWAAISRAVRTPSRANCCIHAATFNIPPFTGINRSPAPLSVWLDGNSSFKAEEVWAYELGYRFTPHPNLGFDLALFHNQYDKLRSWNRHRYWLIRSGVSLDAHFASLNDLSAAAYGVELAMDWRPLDRWSLEATYSYLYLHFATRPSTMSTDVGSQPTHQASLRSGFDLTNSLNLDLWLRYVDQLRLGRTPNPAFHPGIPAYWTLDSRLAWRPLSGLELSITGQNLLSRHHVEFVQEAYGPPRMEIPRSFYLQLHWQF